MKPHRILHVITRLVVGGAQENTVATAAGLRARGHDVLLCSGPTDGTEGSLVGRARRLGIPLVVVPDLVREVSPARDAAALVRLHRLVREGAFDVVHTHTSKAGVLGRLAAGLARSPAIVHTPHGHVFDGYFGPWATRTFVAIERACARLTHAMVAISEECRADHLRLGIGRPERFVTIPSGIPAPPADRAAARRALGVRQGDLVVGCVGRLVPVKGQQVLLDAFARAAAGCPNGRLVLVGDGPARENLEARVARAGLDGSVRFLGLRDDVPALLAGFDLYVQPSLNEGMGRALAQAMAAGLPVVATDAPGPLSLVGRDGAGVIVRRGAVDDLAGAIAGLLADPAARERLGRAGRRRAETFWGEDDMVDAIERLYGEILSSPAASSKGGGRWLTTS